jgi:galactofuranosylgalactofuranosylrhamnosyl-N-acetylglucosaminyl-diphospho-decaprenol beta-1,5/1,6-galactofuranosyltransferase
MYPLHRLVFPAASDKHEGLYLNAIGERPAGFDNPAIDLAAGEGFRADTYFGVFPLNQWKRLARLRSLLLALNGEGLVHVRIRALGSAENTDPVLFEQETNLGTVLDISEALESASWEGIYLELTARTTVRLKDVAFTTADAPRRQVHLGLSITTFGRAEMVTHTIGKLTDLIARDPEPELGSLSLAIVDNGRQLDVQGFPGATIVPNANLGGAGGFARGLAHYSESAHTTHVCFMDDDAATEEECLLRARRILAFAIDDRTAVSSAMLRAETSFMMHEQGALFEWGENHRIISRKNGLDLLRRSDLLEALRPEEIAYGGWWFFAFPIRAKLIFPYPLFVRGDDWLFSYLNDFNIETMPGIASWQEGFEGKISPTEQYLATKAFLVAELILRDPPNPLATARFFARWVTRNIFGYCYDRAALNCEAISDVLKGPQFWGKNVALGKRLGEIRQQVSSEKLQPIVANTGGHLARAVRSERRSKALLRILTLNGHLLPSGLFGAVDKHIDVHLLDAPQPRFTFGRSQVRYVNPAQGKMFLAAKDTARALALLFHLAGLMIKLVLNYRKLRADYRQAIELFGTKAWWDDAFRKNG